MRRPNPPSGRRFGGRFVPTVTPLPGPTVASHELRIAPAGGRFRPVVGSPSQVLHTMRPVALTVVLAALVAADIAEAAGTGFDPRVVAFGEARQELKSIPITERPNRPLHVYGNTVRRRHHRGGVAPARPQAPR